MVMAAKLRRVNRPGRLDVAAGVVVAIVGVIASSGIVADVSDSGSSIGPNRPRTFASITHV